MDEDVAQREICFRLTEELFGKQMTYVEFKWPATWWEAFKERWFPKAWLKWYPVKYEHRSVDVWQFYTGFEIPEYQNFMELHVATLPHCYSTHDWSEHEFIR